MSRNFTACYQNKNHPLTPSFPDISSGLISVGERRGKVPLFQRGIQGDLKKSPFLGGIAKKSPNVKMEITTRSFKKSKNGQELLLTIYIIPINEEKNNLYITKPTHAIRHPNGIPLYVISSKQMYMRYNNTKFERQKQK